MLFRSAALSGGPRVISVVLSGACDDGTAGAAAVVRHGGVSLVQDPAEALYPAMPRSVLDHLPETEAHALKALSGRIVELVSRPVPLRLAVEVDPLPRAETEIDTLLPTTTDELPSRPAGFGCPSCHGALFELDGAPSPRYRCRIGHAWSPESLLDEQPGALEGALWSALRSLEERAALSERMARLADDRGSAAITARYAASVGEAERAARLLRRLIGMGPDGVRAVEAYDAG